MNKKTKLDNDKTRAREFYPMSNGRTSRTTDYRIRPARKSISFQFEPTATSPTEAQNIVKRRSTRLESLAKIKRQLTKVLGSEYR